jgi:hypothetical protein
MLLAVLEIVLGVHPRQGRATQATRPSIGVTKVAGSSLAYLFRGVYLGVQGVAWRHHLWRENWHLASEKQVETRLLSAIAPKTNHCLADEVLGRLS